MSKSTTDYDLIIAGGGLAGSALAIAMRRAGCRVLVVEQETRFRDRIRGEVLMPWGSREAKRLDIYDELLAGCGLEAPIWSSAGASGHVTGIRDLVATTPERDCCLTFPHPLMQETLLGIAAASGVEVLRGVSLDQIDPGTRPAARVTFKDAPRKISARLIVVADGRESRLRSALGFDLRRDREFILIAGMLLRSDAEFGRRIDGDAGDTTRRIQEFADSTRQRLIIAFSVAPKLNRIYLMHHKDAFSRRLSGERALEEAVKEFRALGTPTTWFEGATLAGPLGTFDGAARWVDRPYRDGVVLIGDAAGATDPVWGEGLSRTLRDVRLLRDRLVATDDWRAAAAAYAADHDDFFGRMLRIDAMRGELFFDVGPVANARRKRAFAAQERNPGVRLDTLALGPDAPCDDAARARYFGEA